MQSESARKPPKAGEIHLWRAELEGAERRESARHSLREILAGYLGGTAGDVDLAVDESGKPRLAVRPERLSFNLSHSGGLALVAVATGGVAVGVDVEQLRPRRQLLRLARRWLPGDEAEAVARAPEREREATFYAAWTRHEARVKCTGAGLGGPAPGPEVVTLALEIDPGYAAALAFPAGGTQAGGDKEPNPIFVRRFWFTA
jgi:4'-phosphopantetheinyl transferase